MRLVAATSAASLAKRRSCIRVVGMQVPALNPYSVCAHEGHASEADLAVSGRTDT